MTIRLATKIENKAFCFYNTLILKAIIFTCLVCFLIAGGLWHQKKVAVSVPKNPQLKTITIPKVELKPIANIAQHTDLVGTPEKPTFDGGIINAADGLTVNHFEEPVARVQIEPSKNANAANFKKENSEDKFKDTWATSSRVKELLKAAADEGKLNYVLQKLDEKGLPASLATVPMIESNYKVTETSNKGAAGAWQLMPETAKGYGISALERYHFGISTAVALDLLNDLHKQFGNWELALAAYNAGSGRVEKALKKNPQAKSIKELDLPAETKAYVAHIMSLNQKLAAVNNG